MKGIYDIYCHFKYSCQAVSQSFHKFRGTTKQFSTFNKHTLYGNNFLDSSKIQFILESSALALQKAS